jgi:hypothetical protein
MKVLGFAALMIAGAAVVGCGTVRENTYNETPINQRVAYQYDRETDVVYLQPTHEVVYVHPAYRAVPVTRYYYVD